MQDHPGHAPATAGAASFWRSRSGVAFIAFAVIAAFFLLVEHRAHVFQYLPFALLLLCPLMHVFMHGGHGGHGRHASHDRAGRAPGGSDRPGDRGP